MIIDDNKIDLFVSQKIIEKYDSEINVRTFNSATSALNYLKICPLKHNSETIVMPDVILLDINMPQIDGFQFIEEYKALNLPKAKDVKIIMLTSSLYLEDIQRAEKEAYCSGYIDKPLTKEKIEKLVKKHSSSRGSRGVQPFSFVPVLF
ncbi:MAG: response regulator [Winogradskyella sp.]|nr:response regulator [Winogradskyella sp.]